MIRNWEIRELKKFLNCELNSIIKFFVTQFTIPFARFTIIFNLPTLVDLLADVFLIYFANHGHFFIVNGWDA